MSKIQIKAHTSFLGHTGYNNHSKNFFTNLNKYIPTRVRNYSYCNDLSYLKPEEMALVIEHESPFVRDPEAKLVNIVLNESNHYYFYEQYESPMIAYNVWESTRQTREYFNRILEYDQFWCPTEWQRQCTIDQGYPADRIKVVHEGVNGNLFRPFSDSNPLKYKNKLYEKYSIPHDTFTFMIFGRWDYRKFTTEMIQAFCEEFKDDDQVMLMLSADNPFPSDGMKTTEERLDHYKFNSEKIKILHFPPREDYIQFLQHGNCLLSCSRSEGWNLPLMEALACGTPSVASNWGGHLEFADGIAHLVDVPKELPPKEIFMVDSGSELGVWGEPDFDHLKKVMRTVYENYSEVKEDTVKKSKHIREKFTWDNAAKTAVRHINTLCEKTIPIRSQKTNAEFYTKLEIVDGNSRVTFGSSKDFKGKAFVVIQSDEDDHHESWFGIEPGGRYWISLPNIVNKIKFELFDERLNLIYSETKIAKDVVNVKHETIDEKDKDKLKLNLGCGNITIPGYINADKYNNTGNVDITCDLGDLPFLDDSLDEIYTSHVFEHISINDIYAVVEEWWRALKPDGDLVMNLPNLEYEVKGWLEADDDKKWFELHRIFGGQSYEGNFHYCGFNPESLKSFIEKFDFEVLEIYEQDRGYGNDIHMHAKKIEKSERPKASYTCHFVDGPFLEVKSSETNNFFIADFLDPDNNSLVHQETVLTNTWTKPHRKYFTNWLIQVRRNGSLDFEHKFNLKDKKVMISFDSKSLGDSIAWIPVVEEFRKKHECEVWVSTFWNKLFDKCEEYKNLNWVEPGGVVHDLYATYMVGCFDGDTNRNKREWRTVSLQKIAGDILGIDCDKEYVANIVTKEGRKRVTEEPYVAISEFSTFQCKHWDYPGGWQEVVDYLNDIGYKVVVISKEKTKLKNVINRTNKTMAESINTIKESEFFMGVSSGPAWLAWALKTPTVMISGCTEKWLEFRNKMQRVVNEDVCHGCFNSTEDDFDRGNWNYCPVHKGTLRQFECTKLINPDMVKEAINGLIIKENLKDIKVNETKEFFYVPPDNEIKNLRYETKGFHWDNFQQFGPVKTAYFEIFEEQDYKHEGCKIEKGDIVVDIGANVGIFTRYAYVHGAGKIFSFEAEKTNFEYLLKNKPEICSAFNLAVSDNNDKQNLCVKELEGSHTLLFDSTNEGNIQEIQCITLDKIFETYKLDKIDFLKLDIEGSELKAFDGITDENLSKVRKVSLEYHHMMFNFDDNIRDGLIQRFIRLGFKIYTLHLRDDYLNMIYFWK